MTSELTAMQVLRAALDARARYTGTHTEATGLLAAAVAHRLGLDHAKLADIERVALLHDIGTICVPDYIARKRGALDRVEWQTMRRHTEFGAQIVASVSSLAHLAPAIRAGHECWDGTGHPDGLAGDQIPVASRIIQGLQCLVRHDQRPAVPQGNGSGDGAARPALPSRQPV